MPAYEDVVALVLQRDHLAPLQLRRGGKEGAHEVGDEEAERGGEVVED